MEVMRTITLWESPRNMPSDLGSHLDRNVEPENY